MNQRQVLLTGAFGNIGSHTVRALLARGHRVRCFDLPTRANRRAAARLRRTARAAGGQFEVHWGDLRSAEAVARAAAGQDTVLHLGFVIPKLSATGVNSEEQPDWARAVNVGGTRNIIAALQAQPRPARLVFASSLHVFGRTQHLSPPRSAADPVEPVEHYASHKVECEQMVRASGLEWAVFRLPATLPVRLILDRGVFDVPLDNRIEYAHGRDVGQAFAAAVDSLEIWGKVLLIGGGPRCQLIYGDLVRRVMETVGVGMLPAQAFTGTPYSVDWLDTAESQRLLEYQRHTLEDYVREVRRLVGWRQPLIRLFRPLVRWWMLRQSPYYRATRA